MLSKTRSNTGRFPRPAATPVDSRSPGMIPTAVPRPLGSGAPIAREPDVAARQPAAQGTETRRGRFRREARRTRLYGYAIATVALVASTVALVAYLIALAVSNTTHVKISWVFGSSRVSLVWLVLFAAILGWLLGLATGARFHWRTRAPRQQGGESS